MKEMLVAKIESRTRAIANLLTVIERQQKSLAVLIEQMTAHEVAMSECDGASPGKLNWLKKAENAIEANERVIARHQADIAGFNREFDAITAEETRATERTVTQIIAAINGRRVGKNPTRRYVPKGTPKAVKAEDKPKPTKRGQQSRGKKHGQQRKAA